MLRTEEIRLERLKTLDHIDPHGRKFGIACFRCGVLHTRPEDEAVMARRRAKA
jgi:hypothetical protein